MVPLTQWTWVWANSWRWWRTGKPGMLHSTGLQRVRHDRTTEQQSVGVGAQGCPIQGLAGSKYQCSFHQLLCRLIKQSVTLKPLRIRGHFLLQIPYKLLGRGVNGGSITQVHISANSGSTERPVWGRPPPAHGCPPLLFASLTGNLEASLFRISWSCFSLFTWLSMLGFCLLSSINHVCVLKKI